MNKQKDLEKAWRKMIINSEYGFSLTSHTFILYDNDIQLKISGEGK